MSSPASDRLAMAFPSLALLGATGGGCGAQAPADPLAGEGGPVASAEPAMSPARRRLSRTSYSSRFGDAPPIAGRGHGLGASAAAGGSGSNGGSWEMFKRLVTLLYLCKQTLFEVKVILEETRQIILVEIPKVMRLFLKDLRDGCKSSRYLPAAM